MHQRESNHASSDLQSDVLSFIPEGLLEFDNAKKYYKDHRIHDPPSL